MKSIPDQMMDAMVNFTKKMKADMDSTPPFNPLPEGIRKVGPTNALRSSKDGLGRYDLLDPWTLQNDALWTEMGAKIHGDNNWKLGIPLKIYLSSAMRHMVKLMNGDKDEDHVSAVRWNMMGFAWTLCKIRKGELPQSLREDTVYEKRVKPSFREYTSGGPDDPRMGPTYEKGDTLDPTI